MFRLLILKDDVEVYENKYVSRRKQQLPVRGYGFAYSDLQWEDLQWEVWLEFDHPHSSKTRLRALLLYRNTFVANMPIKYVCKHSRSLNVQTVVTEE